MKKKRVMFLITRRKHRKHTLDSILQVQLSLPQTTYSKNALIKLLSETLHTIRDLILIITIGRNKKSSVIDRSVTGKIMSSTCHP